MATTSTTFPTDYDYFSIKLLLVGDSGVGKSCLLLRFSDGAFTTSFIKTIGIDFKTITMEMDRERIKLQIWDIAGDERFLPITEAYYRGAMGLLLVYDVTVETSFLNIKKWMNKFKKFAIDDAQVILVGNKVDVDNSIRVVPISSGQKLANEYGIKFYETSAKSNFCIKDVLFAISKDILQSEMKEVKEQRLKREKALKRPIHYNDSEADENSTASPSLPDAYKINRHGNDFNIGLLVDILSNGTFIEKKAALTALYTLSILQKNRTKIVQAGGVKHLLQLMNPAFGLNDEATTILAKLAEVDEGRNEIVEKDGIPLLVDTVALGSEKGRENAINALAKISRSNSKNCRLVVQADIIPQLLDLTQYGTIGAKENAQALLDYFESQGAYPITHQEPPLSHREEDTVTFVDSFGSSPRGYGNQNLSWPSSHLLVGENRSLYLCIAVPLYNASLNGDWKTAKKLIDENFYVGPKNLLCCSITNRYETALHIAAGARQVAFVEELLKFLEPGDLTLKDWMGNTAFCLAAANGAVSIAKMLMEKNPDLLFIPSTANITPLYIAAAFGHRNMAWFLYGKTMDSTENRQGIFFRCIDTGLFDLALELLYEDGRLAVARNEYDETALHLLARKPSIFSGKNSGALKGLRRRLQLLARKLSRFSSKNCGTLLRLKRLFIKSYKNAGLGYKDHRGSKSNNSLELVRCIFKHILNEPFSDIGNLINHPTRVLFEAARMGNYTFLAELIRLYPELIWEVNDVNQTIFHIAVLHRHINIFNQIHKIGSIKDEIVTYEGDHGDNILHLAAKIPSSDRLNIVSGAALQMHQELMWFKEVKRITPLLLREKIGSEGLTPRELFIREHKDLVNDGEKWMKNTARSCMIVATLITTVVFASAFSVPGGNNDSGTPIQIKETLFHVFAISDAIALSSSIISSLMFLYILTSRYAEEDFLESLPFKLMVGLATLFISMITMMVAFMAAFFLAYHQRKLRWVPILSSSCLTLPVTLFVMLLSPLFRDIFRAACWGSPFRSSGSESKQAGTMIPQERANLPPPPQEKY